MIWMLKKEGNGTMKKLLTGLVVFTMAQGITFSTASASDGFHYPQSWDKNSILRKDTYGGKVSCYSREEKICRFNLAWTVMIYAVVMYFVYRYKKFGEENL
ncbi:hypothetical protein ASG65_22085 [Bacillus sp. Leaf13]|nr:hypothetical protein ASG65_22085 [Bacillus sp. Leaf13]